MNETHKLTIRIDGMYPVNISVCILTLGYQYNPPFLPNRTQTFELRIIVHRGWIVAAHNLALWVVT